MSRRFSKDKLIESGLTEVSPGVWVKQYTLSESDIDSLVPIKINVKPLSVNQAYRGRRFKTPKYHEFSRLVLKALPAKIILPPPPYEIRLKFGFSSSLSDWDNPIKTCQDLLAFKYKFNDKLIRRGVVDVDIVDKGCEYFEFIILPLVR